MHRGETITTVISNFPIPISDIEDLYIVFRNEYKTLLEKRLADCVVSGEKVSFTLTQEESLSLSEGRIRRSVILITKDGSRLESRPSDIKCYKTAKNEVL